jgi:ATP-dependent DNA helicase RecQ
VDTAAPTRRAAPDPKAAPEAVRPAPRPPRPRAEPTPPPAVKGAEPYPPHSVVRHRAWGTGTVLGYEEDRMTVLFDTVGYKTLSVAVVMKGNLLVMED